ncbi:3-hydroxyacyl-CoA dehydrogenase [Thalassobaculum fulvum]|uniref:3-hydroxyacyl-CoA dehydrogenase n=1 Tax=Thalassobaculum fulvum TaxID=1633335 RepID=A0A918XS94_9PROT|nr:3-hydroxyacyl-CoA dehydrogenase NAD-binding domain-containing protein [Thalassobaculum fulvum]GHD51933.1 3-hydroxyacyl-CoA dehydrogenase [Thalassobaculum fulvum]
MTDAVRYSREGAIGLIEVVNPPVNALGQAVRAGISAAIRQGIADPDAKVLVIYGEGRTFMAGADIREFGKPPMPPILGEVINEIEACPKPTVAAIHGTALGGGLETALGCRFRVALKGSKVGLPEVKLGIIPGAGGTQRLPRVAGVANALEMITSGRHVPVEEALTLGIVDAVVDGTDVKAAGIAFARRVVDEGLDAPAVRDRDDKLAAARADRSIFEETRRKLARSMRGRMSPQKAVDAVEAAVDLAIDQGLKRERELITECMESSQRAGLVHAFFGEREVAKVPGMSKDVPVRPVKKAAVIGAGTMGGGIAMCFANAGIPVTVVETSQEALDRGLGRVRNNYDISARRGRYTPEQVDGLMALFTPALDLAAVAEADIVIEAVFESMDVKKEVFRKLDAVAKPGAVLATNTSYLDVDEIAAVTSRPADVLGMHFFSPANVMKLLEVVRGAKTADDALKTALEIGRKLGKVAVVAGVCDGFIGNRMLKTYKTQMDYVMEDGALPQEIDAAITGFGFPMGLYAMGDLAGLDIGYMTRRREDATRPADARYVAIADRLYELGRLGQKTGAGWYRYEDGRTPIPDPEVEAIILEESGKKGINRRAFGADEILTRALCALVNEGAKVLAEGIALRPVDIDMVWLFGYGFPAYEGGPMFWADRRGLDKVLADIRGFADHDPKSWQPAPLLVELAEAGRTFKEWSDAR